MGKHNWILGFVGAAFLVASGWAFALYNKIDDRTVNAMRELTVTQTDVKNHEKVLDRLQRELTDSRQTVMALASPAARTCGELLTVGRVVRATGELLQLHVETNRYEYRWKDSTTILDSLGNRKAWSDLRPGMLVVLCYDNDNGVNRVHKLTIQPDNPQTAPPPLAPRPPPGRRG